MTEFEKIIKALNRKSGITSLQYEKELLSYYKKSLERVRAEILKVYEKANVNTIQITKLSQLENNIQNEIIKLTKKSTATIKSGVNSIFEMNYKGIGKGLKTAVGFGIINDKSISTVALNEFQWTGAQTTYGNKLLNNIKSEIVLGNIQGKAVEEISKNITRQFNITANNALRIVRTETHRAESIARNIAIEDNMEIAKNNGYKLVKIWSAASDAREAHLDADGTEADENGFFNVGGELLEYPGDGSPENSINCRCSVVVDLKEEN